MIWIWIVLNWLFNLRNGRFHLWLSHKLSYLYMTADTEKLYTSVKSIFGYVWLQGRLKGIVHLKMANLSSFTHFIHRLSCGTELNFTVRLGTTWGSINDDKMFILHERSLNSPVWKAIQWFLMPFLLNKKNTNNTNKKKN